VPLYLSLEQTDGAEGDEVGQVCLRVRHGSGQTEEEGAGLTFFLYTSAGTYKRAFSPPFSSGTDRVCS
jgi:hypothetical protein